MSCLKLLKELLPNELKLRDEGALKTFTLFLLGFILMAALQALEAYLDIWFLYQTDTFHAEIIINTCVTRRQSGLKFSFLWRWLGWKLIIVFNWAYLCHCDYTVTTLWQHCVLVTNNTMYWPYTAYTWFIQLLLWRHHMVKATLKIELCEIEVENTSRELLIFEYQAWFEIVTSRDLWIQA